MKNLTNLTLILLTILTFGCNKEENKTYNGNVILTTQKELDEFGSRNYEVIQGNLQIGIVGDIKEAADIISIKALSSLKRIESDLVISYTSLNSTEGLKNLEHIGGDFRFSHNDRIEEIRGLTNIEFLGGGIVIGFNHMLNEIRDLEHFNSSIKSLGILDNQRLKRIYGLQNITSIEGHLNIYRNPDLENIDFLKNITSVSGSFNITLNNSLTDLGELKLESIGGSLVIQQNRVLNNLDGLANLSNVTYGIEIFANAELTDFCGISNALEKFDGILKLSTIEFEPTKEEILAGNCAME